MFKTLFCHLSQHTFNIMSVSTKFWPFFSIVSAFSFPIHSNKNNTFCCEGVFITMQKRLSCQDVSQAK